ncbi:hypothetical protein D3OALGA1CA_5405 [Olavius algarvensis associated proteobacterium Delta 3]|nr:hypothetical protein D3OALGB2SA_1551 [Olavius algarvensis associated proteobacterium Delta 3]CAB5166226.1 hypothetical protein D3OALGA1CA_5405 [Olavius algarvensis associated proteobacterium Delta 3]
MTGEGSMIVPCSNCGAKNRIPIERFGAAAKCGKCATDLDTDIRYTLRCTGCGAKNRVPANKLNAGAKCGKCSEPLATAELSAPQPMMISDMNFDEKVMKSPLPVLLFAWAPS